METNSYGTRIQISDLGQLPQFWIGSLAGESVLDTITDLRLGFFKLHATLGVISGDGIMSGGVPFIISGSFDPAIQPSETRRYIWAEMALTVVCQFPHEEQYVVCIDTYYARMEGVHIENNRYTFLLEACDTERTTAMQQKIQTLFQNPAVARLLPPSAPIAEYVQTSPYAEQAQTEMFPVPVEMEPMETIELPLAAEQKPKASAQLTPKKVQRWKKKDTSLPEATELPPEPESPHLRWLETSTLKHVLEDQAADKIINPVEHQALEYSFLNPLPQLDAQAMALPEAGLEWRAHESPATSRRDRPRRHARATTTKPEPSPPAEKIHTPRRVARLQKKSATLSPSTGIEKEFTTPPRRGKPAHGTAGDLFSQLEHLGILSGRASKITPS